MADEASREKRQKYIYNALNKAMPTAFGKFQAEKVASVLIDALDGYDRNLFVTTEQKFWNPNFADETGKVVIERMLMAGCNKVEEYCKSEHPEPKSCECRKYQSIFMGMGA
jgi:hypothetical protein